MGIIENEHEIVFFADGEFITSNIRHIEAEIMEYVDKSDKDIVIDMSNQTKIDSMAIAALIRIKNKLIDKERGFKIINPGMGVTRVLEISGLENFLLE